MKPKSMQSKNFTATQEFFNISTSENKTSFKEKNKGSWNPFLQQTTSLWIQAPLAATEHLVIIQLETCWCQWRYVSYYEDECVSLSFQLEEQLKKIPTLD